MARQSTISRLPEKAGIDTRPGRACKEKFAINEVRYSIKKWREYGGFFFGKAITEGLAGVIKTAFGEIVGESAERSNLS